MEACMAQVLDMRGKARPCRQLCQVCGGGCPALELSAALWPLLHGGRTGELQAGDRRVGHEGQDQTLQAVPCR